MDYKPSVRMYLGISLLLCTTMALVYLDFRYTLIPRYSYHHGNLTEELFIWKYDNVYNNTSRKSKQILLWTGFFDSPEVWDKHLNAYFTNCKYSCSATTNKQYLPLSDAVIFHETDMDFRDLPGIRIHRQPWILFTLEPTTLIKKNYQWFNGVFNWTLSYRNHSTVLGKYGSYTVKKDRRQVPPVSLKHKNRTAYAAISNCHDAGRRFKFINEISKHMEVDIYGRCSSKKCIGNHGPCLPKKELDLYKFKLAFENSHCTNYVTEKYWQTLQSDSDMIPIVNWIEGQAHPNIIPNSYINIYDFKTTEEFINYINKVSSNETLFQQYFEWRKKFKYGGYGDMYCDMCEKLHKPYQAQVYNDLGGWFKDDTCTKYSIAGMVGRWIDRRIFNIFNKEINS